MILDMVSSSSERNKFTHCQLNSFYFIFILFRSKVTIKVSLSKILQRTLFGNQLVNIYDLR
jgi:hypothetical protein